MNERQYQTKLTKKLKVLLPGCYVLRSDPRQIQGIPDLIVLHHDTWFALELKESRLSPYRPNQEYHLQKLDEMSAAFVIYPENEDEVLDAIQRSFGASR